MSALPKRILINAVAIVVGTSAVLAYWHFQQRQKDERKIPRVPVRPAADTTWRTEPLNDDGTVNYVAAINAHFGKGVRPGENAAVDLLKIMGPMRMDSTTVDRIIERLGVDRSVLEGRRLPLPSDFCTPPKPAGSSRPRYDPTPRELLRLAAVDVGKAHPEILRWLRAHQEPLDQAVRASTRPRYFMPLAAPSTPERLPQVQRPDDDHHEAVVLGLLARACARVAAGSCDTAVDDLLAAHRWTRLLMQSAVSREIVRAVHLSRFAEKATSAIAGSGKLSAAQVRRLRAGLDALGVPEMTDEPVRWWDRLFYLDALQVAAVDSLADGMGLLSDQHELIYLKDAGTDYNQVMRQVNHWFDRRVNAAAIADKKARLREERLVAEEWAAVQTQILDRRYPKPKCDPVAIDTRDALLPMVVRAPPDLLRCQDDLALPRQMTRLALALALYKAEKGRYPADLEALVAAYIPSVPDDPYSRGPLKYTSDGKTFMAYSIGPNGVDDKGVGDQLNADDIAIRGQ